MLGLITRERQTGEARTAALKAALALVDAGAPQRPSDVRTWPLWGPLEPHCRALVDHAEQASIAEPTVRLMSDLAVLRYAKARHAEAEPLVRQALIILLRFVHDTGYPRPHLRAANRNYRALLDQMPKFRDGIAVRIGSLAPEAGIDEADLTRLLEDPSGHEAPAS